MSGNKSPVSIVQSRLSEMVEMTLSMEDKEMRNKDYALKWGVSLRQVERYRQAANRIIKDKRNQDIDTVYVKHLRERRKLYEKALSEKDYRFALTILQDIGKIEGVYSPDILTLVKNEQNNFDLSSLPQERLETVLLKYFDGAISKIKVVSNEPSN